MTDIKTAAQKARHWTERRDALIRQRSAAGDSLRTIASEVGLSHSAVAKILKRG